jgi:ABC-type branched-subunit amino acid transport system substrate-binding protein
MKLICITSLMIVSTLLLSACTPDFAAMAERRVQIARLNSGDIKVVAIKSTSNNNYINGVLLAAKQINQRPQKLLNRPLKIQLETETDNFQDTRHIIERIVSDPRVTAVLGHRTSAVAVPASAIYEKSQVIFMPSFATGKVLTGHNFKYVFRMAPSSVVMGEQIAFAAKTLGYKKIAIFYGRDELSKEEAFLFEDATIKLSESAKTKSISKDATTKSNIDVIITRISFFSKATNYRPKISQLSDKEFDAIFIAADADSAGRLTQQLREMGMNHPILGDDSFLRDDYLAAAGKSANNVIVPTIYNRDLESEINQSFRKLYKETYDSEEPDYSAAQGYDSLMLLADVIKQANTTLPSVLISTLHYMSAWVGVTGLHSFNDYGDIQGKKYSFQVRKENQWHHLPALHLPYSLFQFRQRQIERYKLKEEDITNFLNIFKKRMHINDRKAYLIDLAHEIIRFKKIGIIYEDTMEGRTASGYDILTSVATQKAFKVISCKIPFSILSVEQIKRELIACYGKLPLESEVIYMNPHEGIDEGIDKDFIQVLNKNLAFFKIPTISIEQDEINPYITLSLSSDKNLSSENISNVNVYSNILTKLKIHELAETLQGLPKIVVNLEHIKKMNLSETAIIKLSPDFYSGLIPSSTIKKGK